MKFSVGLVLRGILPCIKRLETFLHAGVIDAQELILGGRHVDEIWLALSAFLIKELVY